MSTRNLVEINLPLHAGADLPEPGKPVLTINGMAVEDVTRVEIRCGVDEITHVTVTFAADIKGKVDAFTEAAKVSLDAPRVEKVRL